MWRPWSRRGWPYLLQTGGPPSAPRVSTVPCARPLSDPGVMTPIAVDPERAEAEAHPVRPPAPPPRRRRREGVARAERPLLLTGLALVTAHLLDLAFSGPDTSVLGVARDRRPRRHVGAGPAPRHAADQARARSRGRAGGRRLRRRLSRPARRQPRPGLARRHRRRLHRRRAAARRGRHRRHRVGASRAPTKRPRLARRPRGRVDCRRVGHGAGLRAAVHRRQPGHPRPALGDRRVRRRDPARGGADRHARRAQALSRPGTSRRATARRCCSATARAAAAGASPPTCGCSRVTATACWRSTTRATARATGTPTASATTPSRRSPWRWASTISKGRPDVNPKRIAGFGVSLGGEVLLDAAAHDRRLAAVVSDGATRPMDGDTATTPRARWRARSGG